MFFKEIIGQTDIRDRLIRSAQQDQIAHALLFAGPRGVGKLATALAFARYVQCTDRGEYDACGRCPSCLQHSRQEHPDLHFVFPMVKNEKRKVTVCDDLLPEWRAFLKEGPYPDLRLWMRRIDAENGQPTIYTRESEEIIRKLSLKSYESDYKILIVWLPERMQEECANKLLKLLEEPYEKTLFLLVSEQPDALLDTIRSRTQQVYLPPLRPEQIETALQEQYQLTAADAAAVAHNAGGSYLTALETIRLTEDRTVFFDAFVRLMRLAYARDIKALKDWSEEVAGLGREQQKQLLEYTQRMIRENFILNLRERQLNHLREEEAAFSSRFSPFVNEGNIYPLMNELAAAQNDIERNGNARIVFFDLAIRAIMLLKQQ